MFNSDFLFISSFYLLLGTLFHKIFLNFAKQEISKWTNEKIAIDCTSFKVKWVFLNILFMIYCSKIHSVNILSFTDEIIFQKEFFKCIVVCVWISVLIALAKIDLETNLLPDRLTITLGVVGILYSVFNESLSVVQSLTSAFFGFIFIMLTIFFLFRLRRLLQEKNIKVIGL